MTMIDSHEESIPLFAAIKIFYENGSDVLSAVCSLTLVTVSNGNGLEEIRQSFCDKYKVSMPVAVLQTILKRLKRNEFIEYDSHQSNMQLTEKDALEASKLTESTRSLSREFMALSYDLRKFFKNKNYPALLDVQQELLNFIDDNLGLASDLMTTDLGASEIKLHRIAEYILHVEHTNPEMYRFLQNVFFGRLYLSMVRTRTEYSKEVSMQPIDAYLDTSLVISLLGFHDKADVEGAKELLEIIVSTSNMKACVFTETIEECKRLLKSYNQQTLNFAKNIRVRSFHYELSKQGYDRARVLVLIETLEDKISNLGINIIDSPTTESTSEYEIIRDEIKTWAELMNAPKGQRTLDHDTNVLHAVKLLRGGVKTNLLEKSKAVFVSPDRAVLEMARENARKNDSFPLSLQPLEIVSVLWMRDIGSTQIASNVVRQSMMAYAREKAISNNLWQEFITALKDARDREILSKTDIALILASDDVAAILAEKQFTAPDEIVSVKFVEQLRSQKKSLTTKAAFGDDLHEKVETIIHKMSNIVALVLVNAAGVVIAVLLVVGFALAIAKTSLDGVANVIALLLVAVPTLLLFTAGRQWRPAQFIISTRKNLHNKIYDRLRAVLRNRLLQANIDESTVT